MTPDELTTLVNQFARLTEQDTTRSRIIQLAHDGLRLCDDYAELQRQHIRVINERDALRIKVAQLREAVSVLSS